MATKSYKVKTDGRHGLVVHGDGFSLRFAHDISFFNVCRRNRAVTILKEALMQNGTLKTSAIEKVLNNPQWAQRYISALDNNESVRECELLTAQMIAEEIVEAVKASAKAANHK